jgi:molybdate transport system permease protein
MIAGGIPGQTETLTVAIYRLTEIGREDDATTLMLLSILLAFLAMLASNHVLRKGTS